MFELTIKIVFIVLSASLVLSFVRLVLGPSLPDRVVALELVASLTVGTIAAYTVATGVSSFLDVAIVLALTAFLSAVGFARYVEKGARSDD